MGSFYDNVLAPLYGAVDDAVRGPLGWPISNKYQVPRAMDPSQSFTQRMEQLYSLPQAELGPRGNVQGPRFQQPQPASQGVPYYLARPDEPEPHLERGGPMGSPALANVDVSSYRPGQGQQGGRMDVPPPSIDNAPPPGDPDRNEYQSMVQEYLNRLKQPADFPRPTPLTKMQMFNMVLHPEQASELREQYQGTDYKQRLMEFQYNQEREQQAAGIAGQLATRQEDLQRRDAERSWFRESAMANAGAPVPPGYKWKNPELQAVHEQKAHEKSQADLRTKKYLENTSAEAKKKDRQGRLDKIFTEEARLQGLLLNPQAAQAMIMAQSGAGDQDIPTMIQGMKENLNRLKQERSVISAMDDDDYRDFIQLDGETQQRIMEDYLAALGERQTPGANVSTPQP